jgi:hypothetical protein
MDVRVFGLFGARRMAFRFDFSVMDAFHFVVVILYILSDWHVDSIIPLLIVVSFVLARRYVSLV